MADAGSVKALYDQLIQLSLEKIAKAEQYNANTKYADIASFIKENTTKIEKLDNKTIKELFMKLDADNKAIKKLGIDKVEKSTVDGFVERFNKAYALVEKLNNEFIAEKTKADSKLSEIIGKNSRDESIVTAIANFKSILADYINKSKNDIAVALSYFEGQTSSLSTAFKEWQKVDADYQTFKDIFDSLSTTNADALSVEPLKSAKALIDDYIANVDTIKADPNKVEDYRNKFDSKIKTLKVADKINSLPNAKDMFNESIRGLDEIFNSTEFNNPENKDIGYWKRLNQIKAGFELYKTTMSGNVLRAKNDLINAKRLFSQLDTDIKQNKSAREYAKLTSPASKILSISSGKAPISATVSEVVKHLPKWQQTEVISVMNKKSPQDAAKLAEEFETEKTSSEKNGYLNELNDILYILKNADKKDEVINGQPISEIISYIENAVKDGVDIQARTAVYNKYKDVPQFTVVAQYKYNAKDMPNTPSFDDIKKSGIDAVKAMSQVVAYKNTQEQLSKNAESNKNKVAQSSINAQIEKNSKVYEDNMKALNARIKYARRLERTPDEIKQAELTKEAYAKEFKKKGIYDSATGMTKDSKPSDFGLTNAPKPTEYGVSDKENLSVIEQMQSDFNDLSNNNSKLSDIDYAVITNYRISKDVNGFYKELQKIHKQIFIETKKLSDDLRVKLQDEINPSIKTLLDSAIGEITAWSSRYNYNKAKEVYDAVVPAYNKAKMDISVQAEYPQDTGEESRKIVIEQNKKDYPNNIMEKYLEVFKGKPLDEVPQNIYSSVRDGIVNIRSLFKNNQPEEATIEYNRIIGMLESYASGESTVSLETNILKDEANKLFDKLVADIEIQRLDMPISENEIVDSAIEKMKMFAEEGNQNEIQAIYSEIISKIKQAKIIAKNEYIKNINSNAKRMVDDLVLRRSMEKDNNKIISINKAITAIISFASRFDSESMEQLYAKTIEDLGSYSGIDILNIADKFIEISKYKNIIMQANPDLWKNLEESYNSNSVEFFKQYYADAMNLVGSLNNQTKQVIQQELKPQPVSAESNATTPTINNA